MIAIPFVNNGQLQPEEWMIVERLAQCYSLMSEIDGLDKARFGERIQSLQEMILALPAKRALSAKCNGNGTNGKGGKG